MLIVKYTTYNSRIYSIYIEEISLLKKLFETNWKRLLQFKNLNKCDKKLDLVRVLRLYLKN